MTNERFQGEIQLYPENHLLEMPPFHANICLKSATKKLNFAMAKAIYKGYTLDCSCKCLCTLHSLA